MTPHPLRSLFTMTAIALCAIAGGGCAGKHAAGPSGDVSAGGMRVQAVRLGSAGTTSPQNGPVLLVAAKNEWANFTLQVAGLPQTFGKRSYALHVGPLRPTTAAGQLITVSSFSAYQLLELPVDLNRAGFVRQTGLGGGRTELPRALLPVPIDSSGTIDLGKLRDPAQATNSAASAAHASRSDEPLLLWFDLHLPPQTPPGEYTTSCDLVSNVPIASGSEPKIASLPLKLTVHDFVLPDERHLAMVGQLDWNDLKRLYPDTFETVEPRLINRADKRYAPAVQKLDQLVKLAQANRTNLVIPRLQPIVKWPSKPELQWDYFDGVVSPWLKGDAFADKTPLSYWPLPEFDLLQRYPPGSQVQYWAEVASHFDQLDWLSRCPVALRLSGEVSGTGRVGSAQSIMLSVDAQRILGLHPKVRVTVPMEPDQIQFADADHAARVDPRAADRVWAASPGLIASPPVRELPADTPRPQRWLRTDTPGLIPYVGAGGDVTDVRLWAWLAFYRNAPLIQWSGSLPKNDSAKEPADPNELIWFYPGSWFGTDAPLATVQLKWLRRAEQDYEYLWLAQQRGQRVNAQLMARLITKPVEIAPFQPEDPTYSLLCGTVDRDAWDEAMRLIAKSILLREPGRLADRQHDLELNNEMLHWALGLERPTILGRATQWNIDTLARTGDPPLDLRLGIDLYNASDMPPDNNSLTWTQLPEGWQVRPQPLMIPALAPYHVERVNVEAQIDPSRIPPGSSARQPVQLTFINGYTKSPTNVRMILPVANSERHPPGLKVDGSLEDWSAEDCIQDGPLLQLLNRPALQQPRGIELTTASTPSSIYTGWSDDQFYVAFKLAGLSQQEVRATQNFVSYQFRRAWGEDLCQILVQAVYADNSTGPVLHVICKPNGFWIERKGDPRSSAEAWPAFEGAGVRYRGTLDGPNWRGEVAIPWRALAGSLRPDRPVMLRFNLTQHCTDSGESASWAGPIDFGRDDALTGLLFLRDPQAPGMAGPIGR
jgi:hypothetical protein